MAIVEQGGEGSAGAEERLSRISTWLAWATFGIGALIVIGSLLGLADVLSVFPGRRPPRPFAGVVFVALGAALLLARGRPAPARRRAAWVLAAISALLGTQLASGDAFGLIAAIDVKLGGEPRAIVARFTGFGIIATSAALLVRDRGRRRPLPSELLAFAGTTIAFVGLLAHVYAQPYVYRLPGGPAVATAILSPAALLLASVAELTARPDRGVVKLMRSAFATGVPRASVVVPLLLAPALGLVAILIENLASYDHPLAMSLLVGATVVVSLLTTIVTAARVERERDARAAVDAVKAQLARVVESSSDAIMTTTLDGIVTSWNSAAERTYGYSAAEMIGHPVGIIVPPETRDDVARIFATIARGEGIPGYQTRRRRKDGRLVDVSVTVSPLFDAEGRVIGLSGISRDVSEQKKAEKAKAELAAIVETSIDGIVTTNLDGAVTTWNPAAERIYGYAATEMLGRTMGILAPPERADESRELLERLKRGGSIPAYETSRVRKDGTRIDVSLSVSPLVDASGTIVGASGIVRDVTEQKKGEKAKAELASIVTSSNDLIVSTTLDGTIQTWNGGAERIFGYPAGDVIGRSAFAIVAPESVEMARVAIENVARGEAIGWIDVFGVRRDGRRIELSFTGSRVVDDRGEVRGLAWMARDVTAERAAAAELVRAHDSERRLRAWLEGVVEQLPDGVILADAAGHVVKCNRAALGMSLGTPSGVDPLGNAALFDVRHPSGEPVAFADLPLVHAMRGKTSSAELQVRTGDDRTIPILAHAAPLRAEDGRPIGAVVVFQDISVLKQLERMREEWIAVVAHDLRQPVNAIGLLSAVLQRSKTDVLSDDSRDSLQRIRGAAMRLDGMIADLLDASRIEARRLRVRRAPVALTTLVRDFLARSPDLTARRSIRVESDDDVPLVSADAARIEQVLANLLSNAAKYGAEGTDVLLEIRRRDGAVEVAVTNRGEGMTPDQTRRLFERFYRTETAEKGTVPGLGLGLYISHGLVEAHGGKMWAESTPGESTTFRFTLPVEVALPAVEEVTSIRKRAS